MIDPRILDALDQAPDLDYVEVSEQDGRVLQLLGAGVSPERVCTLLGISMQDVKRICTSAGGAR